MYGYQSFPTLPENVHMSYIETLRKEFSLPIGYQDHCDADNDSAFWLPAASMGMDVTILEKHITHDRSLKGIDHESALNPVEFINFVKMVRVVDEAKGISTSRPFTEDEIKYREFQKKSIVAARDLNKGTILTSDALNFMRAEVLGFSPAQIDSIIGKELVKDIEAFQSISKDDIF
jgi:sialic acid synthase SpsE